MIKVFFRKSFFEKGFFNETFVEFYTLASLACVGVWYGGGDGSGAQEGRELRMGRRPTGKGGMGDGP